MHALRQKLLSAASIALLAAGAWAGGTISNGNASLQFVGNPIFSSNFGDCTLLTDTGAPDQGFKYAWYYRTQFNNQNSVMSTSLSPTESYVADTATITYIDAGPGPAGQERFDAQIIAVIADGASPDQVTVTATCRFKSRATAQRTYQLFNLVDLDLSGGGANPGTDDSVTFDTLTFNAHQTEASSANFANVRATAPTRWQVSSGSALRSLLGSGAGNLTNAVGPVNGDVAVAFQWTLTLDPEQEVTVSSSFAINASLLCQSPSITLQPQSVSTCDDGSAQFTIAAGGSAPLSYAWRKGGTTLSDDPPHIVGAGTPQLSIAGALISDADAYDCVVTNACGQIASDTADLSVRRRGDLNCDGDVNNFDIDAFVLALLDPSGYAAAFPTCSILNGDVTCDGLFNNFDIDGFVGCVLGSCP